MGVQALAPARRPLAHLAAVALAVGLVAAWPGTAEAATFVVTTTADAGDGSLRQAILDANENPDADVISFNLPEDDTTITLTSFDLGRALPAITGPVTIDATTQPGWTRTPVVELVGQGASEGATAFWVDSTGFVLKGLSLRNFGEGVRLTSDSSGALVADNQFGTTLDGLAASGVPQNFAVGLLGGSGHQVQENLIANAETGVFLFGETVTESRIEANDIGITRAGDHVLPVNIGIRAQSVGTGHVINGNNVVGGPTSSAGIELADADEVDLTENAVGGRDAEDVPYPGRTQGGVIIGPGVTDLEMYNMWVFGGSGHGMVISANAEDPATGVVEGNGFSANALAGVRIVGTGGYLAFRGNEFVDNGQLGIDVGPLAGVSPQPDGGPVISSVTAGEGGFNVDVAFDGGADAAGQTREIEFFANSVCDPSGFGEGESNYASVEIELGEAGAFAAGAFSGTVSISSEIGLGQFVTATVIGGQSWQQSEFSNCFPVDAPVNQVPSAQSASVSVKTGSIGGFQLRGEDPDGDPLTFTVVDGPEHGTLGSLPTPTCTAGPPSVCTATVAYTPDAGYTGPDSFAYTVSDGELTSAPATFSITVLPLQADLDLTLADSPDPVFAGQNLTYTATVRNNGPDTATGTTVTVADADSPGQLPSGTTFVSASVASSAGGSGTCAQTGFGPVTCTLGTGSIPAGPTTWTVTVVLGLGVEPPTSVSARATVAANEVDPLPGNNSATETTQVVTGDPEDVTVDVPPSDQTTTVATAQTVVVGGETIPIAEPGDTTAAAIDVPPGGPGGTVTVRELDCEPPFCDPTSGAPGTPPIDNRVIQFIPPTANYYDYRHPVRYTIVYDRTVVGGVKPAKVKVLYTKDSDPDTLLQAAKCPKTLTAGTIFPCLQSAKILKVKDPRLRGDLRLVLLGTYNDPKISGFR